MKKRPLISERSLKERGKTMNIFEYHEAEKKGLDSFTVMARAIREHYHGEEDKIPAGMARVMAKIIDDGFLDSVIAEQSELIAHSKRIKERYEEEAKEQQRKMRSAQSAVQALENKKFFLEKEISELKALEEKETDPFLLGAKKAYLYIYNKTADKDKASKAFNSYLQGVGKWKQYSESEKEVQE